MSAIANEFIQQTTRLSNEVTQPFPNSRKVYVQGSRPDVQVPMREVTLTATHGTQGDEENPPVFLYDTSGPYTDPGVPIDLLAGLPALRAPWITERGDTEQLAAPSSHFGRRRQDDPALNHLRFEHLRTPRRAAAGAECHPTALCPRRDRHAGNGILRHPRESAPGRAAP
jgi:phosphomethylpyrimidine synthase